MISPFVAEQLMRLAKRIAEKHQENLGTLYPPASKPGQYPRKRTGNLQRSTVVRPRTVREIERTGQVQIGYLQRAYYGVILEYDMDRTRLADTIRDLIGSNLPDGIVWKSDRSLL